MSTENTDPGRIRSASGRVYGIRMTLPPGDPLAPLLGSDVEMYRWYASAGERDAALADMQREHEYSRVGDRPTLVYEKVERERPAGYAHAPRA
jgi:hypothetical protein